MSLASDSTLAKAPGTACSFVRPASRRPGGRFQTVHTEVFTPCRLSSRTSVRTSLEDSSSWSASLPTSPPEPDPKDRKPFAGPCHLHVLHDGLRPRGLSPPRRLFSRWACASCSAAGRGSLRFPLLSTHLKHLAVPPELRAPFLCSGRPLQPPDPTVLETLCTPRRIHPPNSVGRLTRATNRSVHAWRPASLPTPRALPP